MNPYKVFIVGHEGTTGLRIHERLSGRKDITLLSISDEDRKNIDVITSIAKDADIVFLCLPDAASKEVVAAIGDYPCKIIDTSTAFRTADDWAYGFPELGESYKNDINETTYCEPWLSCERHDCVYCASCESRYCPSRLSFHHYIPHWL